MTEWLLLEGEDRHVIMRTQATGLFVMKESEVTYKPACGLYAPKLDDGMMDGWIQANRGGL